MVEKFILIILLGLAVLYVYRYMKKMITLGDDNDKCNDCQVKKIIGNQKKQKII